MFRRGMIMEDEKKNEMILEINLLAAQGLKSRFKKNQDTTQTYAVIWIDPWTKLRTKIDRAGGAENPTWNDKFLFLVSSDFIASETSGLTVEIYEVGYLRDFLMGTARFLLSSCFGNFTTGIPASSAVHVQRPSGRFLGILNIAATVCNNSNSADVGLFHGSSAISFCDLMSPEVEKEKDTNSFKRRLSQRLRRAVSWDSSTLRPVSSSSSLSTMSSTSSNDEFPLRTVKSLPCLSTMSSFTDHESSAIRSVASSSSLSTMSSDME